MCSSDLLMHEHSRPTDLDHRLVYPWLGSLGAGENSSQGGARSSGGDGRRSGGKSRNEAGRHRDASVRGDRVQCGRRNWRRGIGNESLGQAHASKGKAHCALDLPRPEGEALETAPAEIENVEVLQSDQARIVDESAADERGFLFSGEDAHLMSGRGENQSGEFASILRVADCAGGHEDHSVGAMLRCRPQQTANGLEPSGHACLTQPGLLPADARADASIDSRGGDGVDPSLGPAFSDQQLDGIAADIDDGDAVGHSVNSRGAISSTNSPFNAVRAKRAATSAAMSISIFATFIRIFFILFSIF